MENNVEYQDLLYFGYEFEYGSLTDQSDFIKEIKEQFPNVVLKDAFDSIKGYRQEVYLDKESSDDYYAWLIGKQWYNSSLSMSLIMRSCDKPEQKEKFDKYLALAKKQYPEVFKPECL